MCGITGFLSFAPDHAEGMQAQLQRMCDAIAHRGPDSDGFWIDAAAQVALGHRRLAIVDLSPQGHQPMRSACGRYMLVFNGEIYNHQALRKALPEQAWRGHSDTETMLAAITHWGFEPALQRMVGMFAIVAWDAQERQLLMARDRMGEKPLYYGKLPNGDFAFGSELKALRAHGAWQGRINRDALALYLRHNAIPGEHSIFEGIAKLPPGHWMAVRHDGSVRQHCYWRLQDLASQACARRPSRSDAEAIEGLEQLLGTVIRDQMVADVPLGAFLSGGVDSSAIVALMQRQSTRPVRTFSIGFDQEAYNEAEHAKAVARHLGTEHTELYVTAQDALDVIPQLPRIYDEPFADSSQIPTYLVAKMARQHVTVALSGDAGDELFLGYNRYLIAHRMWRQLRRLPLPLRKAAAAMVLRISPETLTRLGSHLPSLKAHGPLGDKLHKFAHLVLPARDAADMYRRLISHQGDPEAWVHGAHEPATLLSPGTLPAMPSEVEQMALADQLTYLPDDILVKVDRAAMAVSLETRVPLLDHRVVEHAWTLDMKHKIRDGQTKWLLREVLYRHVPRALIERPKKGFAVPLDSWLRGPLKSWADDLLSEPRLRAAGILDAQRVSTLWAEHRSGRRNWQYQLWDVLMFEAWRDSL